jgi:multimeric flavodoxin WrbA
MATSDNRLVVGINGGPRKGWNTDMLIQEALTGAKEEGAATELVDLYKLDFKGCASCFHCKQKARHLNGECVKKDELAPVLKLLGKATGVVMGSPIYVGDVTGCVRNLWERYIFCHLEYDGDQPSVLVRGPAIGLVYVMGVPETLVPVLGYDAMFATHRKFFQNSLKPPFLEALLACDTLQFSDYGKYHAPMFDPEHKKRRREEAFPTDLGKARELGRKLGRATELPLLRKDAP